MSGVIQLGENFVILRCEGFTDPVKIDIKEARNTSTRICSKNNGSPCRNKFEQLQDASEVDNFLAGTIHHAKSKSDLPGKVVPAGKFDPITGKGDKNDPDEIYKEQAEKLMAPSKRR